MDMDKDKAYNKKCLTHYKNTHLKGGKHTSKETIKTLEALLNKE